MVVFIILTGLITAVAEYYINWQMILLVPFVFGLLGKESPRRSFVIGFISTFLFWSTVMLTIDEANDQLLSKKMALIFGLHGSFALELIIAMLGGLLSGLSATSASYLITHRKS